MEEQQNHFALQGPSVPLLMHLSLIDILAVTRVHRASSHTKDAAIYVEVKLANSDRKTGILNNDGEPIWNATVTFSQTEASTVFKIRLKEARKRCPDHLIGQAEVNVDKLLVDCGEDNDSAMEVIGTIIEAAEVIIEMIDDVAKIHPLFHLSWQATSALFKLVSHQLHTDSELIDLVDKMRTAFSFSRETRTLNDKTKMLKPILRDLLNETAECSRFVQEYSRHDFLGRLSRISSGRKISDYSARFVDLRNELDSVVGLNTAREVLDIRIQQQLEALLEPSKSDPNICGQRQSTKRPPLCSGKRVG
ncbi:hypothetical protein ACEPAH_7933 [Sanghuangporus vaninii]